jgi:hypothetical protein
MKNLYTFFLLVLFFCIVQESSAQKTKKLFRSDEPLKFTLVFDSKEVLKDKKSTDEHQAELIHKLEDSTTFTHNIKVSVRGKSRLEICNFPPLKLNFKKKATKNTIFSKQDKLKLVTHCNNYGDNKNYLEKEYLAYKLYNVITPVSINARLCEITYIDKSNRKKTITEKGILLEDIDDVGKRNGLLKFKRDIRNQHSLNEDNLDNFVFFQYLIGNLDWSITEKHNVKILKDDANGLPFAVPYDFDYSGFVNTSYAKVPDGFYKSSVRARIFRGFCKADNYKEKVNYYNSKKEELYKTINEASFLDLEERESVIDYLDKFYDILNDKKLFFKKVVKACEVEHEHLYEK